MQVFATWLGVAGDAGGEEGGRLQTVDCFGRFCIDTVPGWDSFFLLAIFERGRPP